MLINPSSSVSVLSVIIAAQGPLPTVRVSSAQARGAAKKYAYWGAARGEIRARRRDGKLTCVSVERASSDRRVEHLAADDAELIADREGRHEVQNLGLVSEQTARRILRDIGL